MKSRIQKKLSRPMHQARPESLGLKRGLAVLVLAILPFFLTSCGGDSKSKPALNAVAWGDDGFVAVGENGHILTSSDGTDWKLIAGKAALPTLTSVVWTGNSLSRPAVVGTPSGGHLRRIGQRGRLVPRTIFMG